MGGKHARALRGKKSPPSIGKERNHRHIIETFTKLNGVVFERCTSPKCRKHHRKILA